MIDFLSLIGLVCGIAGTGMLIIFVLALLNEQLPMNYFGIFLASSPFILLIIASILLTRRKR
jgi:hypothetical protein